MTPDEKNKDLCAGCSLCCETVTMEIDPPEDFEDIDNMLWYVLHEDVIVYIDHEDDWYLSFKAKCKSLDKVKLCKSYKERPNVCRGYTQEECEKFGDGPFWKVMFTSKEEILEYVKTKPKLLKAYENGLKKVQNKAEKALKA